MQMEQARAAQQSTGNAISPNRGGQKGTKIAAEALTENLQLGRQRLASCDAPEEVRNNNSNGKHEAD